MMNGNKRVYCKEELVGTNEPRKLNALERTGYSFTQYEQDVKIWMLKADISGLSPEQAQIEFTAYWLEMNASVLSLASQSLKFKQKFFQSIQNATEGYKIRSMSFTDF
jgi:hypothetical protein